MGYFDNDNDLDIILAVAESDIGNHDGMDIYLSRGTPYHKLANKSFYFDAINQKFDLNESGDFGRWHVFGNQKVDGNNYSIIKAGYSPLNNVDSISADITVETASTTYYKRVGSEGSAHS